MLARFTGIILHSTSMIKMPCSFPPAAVCTAEPAIHSQSSPRLSFSDPFFFFFFQQARESVRPSVGHSLHILAVFATFWYSTESYVVFVHKNGSTDSRVYNRNLSPIPVISPSAPVPIRRCTAPSSLYKPCLVSDLPLWLLSRRRPDVPGAVRLEPFT